MARTTRNSKVGMITTQELSQLTGFATPTMYNLISSGKIPVKPDKDGLFSLVLGVQGVCEYLRGQVQRATAASADNELRRERTREVKVRRLEREGELVERDHIFGQFAELLGLIRSNIDGVPAAYTRNPIERERLAGLIGEAVSAAKRSIKDRALFFHYQADEEAKNPATSAKDWVGDTSSDTDEDHEE